MSKNTCRSNHICFQVQIHNKFKAILTWSPRSTSNDIIKAVFKVGKPYVQNAGGSDPDVTIAVVFGAVHSSLPFSHSHKILYCL